MAARSRQREAFAARKSSQCPDPASRPESGSRSVKRSRMERVTPWRSGVMAYSLSASQSLPWIEPAQAFVKLVGAIGIGRAPFASLVHRIELDPDAADQVRCFPEIQLKLVDLLGQFLQN